MGNCKSQLGSPIIFTFLISSKFSARLQDFITLPEYQNWFEK
jgi:hypothetical protein